MGRAIDRPGLGAARWGAFALILAASSQPLQAQNARTALPPIEAPVGASIESPALVTPEVTTLSSLPVAPQPPGTPQCPLPSADSAPCIPALTPVRLVIRTHLGSKISTSGQTFAIQLAQPILVEGKELVPAGTAGMGEVVHAKKSGGSGASGELVLAARYLELGDRRLRLRSLNFAVAGQDSIKGVNTLMIASAATIPAISLIGFFVQGKPIDIPEGMEAMAKTAEPFVLELPVAAPQFPPTPVSPPPEQGAIP
jgi:hypothetical protein